MKNFYEYTAKGLENLKKEYSSLPDGRLYIKCSKGSYSFYKYVNGKAAGVKKDEDELYMLARKLYIEFIICEMRKRGKLAESDMAEFRSSKRNFSKTMETAFQLLCRKRIMMDKTSYDWCCRKFDSNPKYPEQLKYKTGEGIKIRSKSERVIANRLEKYMIPYRYEAKLSLDGINCYPDFTILKNDGSLILWEHLGLADNQDYAFNAYRKLENFRKHGFVQHKNLICTYENDIESEQELDRIIKRYCAG